MNWPTDKYRSQATGETLRGRAAQRPDRVGRGARPASPSHGGPRSSHPQEPSRRGSRTTSSRAPPLVARYRSLLAPPTSNTKKIGPIRQTLCKSVTKPTPSMLANPCKPDTPSSPPNERRYLRGLRNIPARARKKGAGRSCAGAHAGAFARAGKGGLASQCPYPLAHGRTPVHALAHMREMARLAAPPAR